MTIPKQKLNHFRKLQLEQIKHLSDHIEAYRTRAASVALRKEILEKQNVRNYQSEYDRIRSHVEDSATPAQTKGHMRNRQAVFLCCLKTLTLYKTETVNDEKRKYFKCRL